MTSHVCYEFGKNICRCNCLRSQRNRANSRDKLKFLENKRPIWMHSGLQFGVSTSNGIEIQRKISSKNNLSPFRGNHMVLTNSLTKRKSKHIKTDSTFESSPDKNARLGENIGFVKEIGTDNEEIKETDDEISSFI